MDKSSKLTAIQRAVENNIALCQSVADAHGIPTVVNNSVWMSQHPMPPYYPNLITRQPNTDVSEHIARLHQNLAPGWGVKDSFAQLDLSSSGFRAIIEGSWFGLSVDALRVEFQSNDCHVKIVQSDGDFERWVTAWDAAMKDIIFPPKIWEDESLQFVLVENQDEHISGGVLLNKSSGGIGMSNWFGEVDTVVWAITRTAISDQYLVGYTDEEAFPLLANCGFRNLQTLKVWISR